MSAGNEIPWMSAMELRGSIAARTLSPVDVARDLLGRIDRIDPGIHAFVTLDADSVLDQARRAEAALFGDEPLGPLHGVPVAIKDTIDTAALRTTYGSLLFAEHVPEADAVIVERLRAAGAIILGKTNTPEFALCGRTANRVAAETLNPWEMARSPAGSSGGSGAAVAAGFCPIAIGTDAGGSIRWPAAFNGVFGLMPSYGMVPKAGCFEGTDFGSTFSSIGPLSRDVRDSAVVLQVIAGHDPRDPTSSRRNVPDYVSACELGVAGLSIGWLAPPALLHRDPGVEEQIRAAWEIFGELGAELRTISMTPPDPFSQGVLMQAGIGRLRALANDAARQSLLTPYVAEAVRAPIPSAEEERQAWTTRRSAIDRMDALFREADVIASPTTCFPAPVLPADPFEMFLPYEQYIALGAVADIAGLASVSIPCGFNEGMPLGLMLMAPRGREDLVLRAAAAFERARPWADKRPPLD